MAQFDDRLIEVILSYGTTRLTLSGGLAISASGQKYANALQDECTIKISNLKKETRDQLATQLTPFNYLQQRKSMVVMAGRISTGLFELYRGDIIECTPSQPPDIILTIKAKTQAWFKNNILAQSQNVSAPLSQIAQQTASMMPDPVTGKPLSLKFEATDKTVSNYSFTGPVVKQIDKIAECANVDCYVDGNTMVVKDRGVALKDQILLLSKDTGMIGVPELTEYGIRVKCLLQPTMKIGGAVRLTSVLNPMLNGDYTSYKVGFEIASRDTPFYSILECSKFPIWQGLAGGIGGIS